MKMSIQLNTKRKILAITLGLIAALMSFADIAYSANRNAIYEVLLDTSPNWDIESNVWINENDPNPSVKIGDSVVFSISSSDFAYYQLFVIDSKGSTTILVPDELDSSFFPAKAFVYPPLPDGCEFPLSDACIRGNNLIQQEGPVGTESVFMLATSRKVPGTVFGIEKGQDAVTVIDGVEGVRNALNSFKSYVARNNVKYTTGAYSYTVDDKTQYATRSLKSTFNSRLSEIKNNNVESGSGIANIFSLNASPENNTGVTTSSNVVNSAVRPVVESVADTKKGPESVQLAENSSGSLTSIFDLQESSSTSGPAQTNTTVLEPQVIVQEQAPNVAVAQQGSGQLSSIFKLKDSNSSPANVTTTDTETQTAVTLPDPQVVTVQVQDSNTERAQPGNGLTSIFDLKKSNLDSSSEAGVRTTAIVSEPEVIQQEQTTDSPVNSQVEDVRTKVVTEPKTTSSQKRVAPRVIDESEFVAEKDTRRKKKSDFEGLDLTDIDVVAYSRKSEPRRSDTQGSETSKPESMVLSDVVFEAGTAILRAKGRVALDGIGSDLLDLQSANKLPVVLIVGHTDSTGPDEDNFILSVNQAKKAKDYLVETFDIPANKIISSGKGEFSPLFPNNSSENRARNRRVEISFLNQ